MTALDSKHENMIKIRKHDFNHMITKQLPLKNSMLFYYSVESNLKVAQSRKSNHVISQDQWEMEWKGVWERKRETEWINRKKKARKSYSQNDSQEKNKNSDT